MPFLMFNYGEKVFAEAGVNKAAAQDLKLIVFKDNHTLADADGDDVYTNKFTEADFPGYASINLTAANWTCTPGAPTLLAYPEQLFQCNSDCPAQGVFGVALVQTTSLKALCGWTFGVPVNVSKSGDKIYHTPKINMKKPSEV
jgi:hypothetical protein